MLLLTEAAGNLSQLQHEARNTLQHVRICYDHKFTYFEWQNAAYLF